jgi:hypothetical protein
MGVFFGCILFVWLSAFVLEIGRICDWLLAEDV